jgi:hypothetical protein
MTANNEVFFWTGPFTGGVFTFFAFKFESWEKEFKVYGNIHLGVCAQEVSIRDTTHRILSSANQQFY